MAFRLTYCFIEDTSLCEDNQSDQVINSLSSKSAALHFIEMLSTGQMELANDIDNPVEDDIMQYARVQIHHLTNTRAREIVTKWITLEYRGKYYHVKMEKVRGQEKDWSSIISKLRRRNDFHTSADYLGNWSSMDEWGNHWRFVRHEDGLWIHLTRLSLIAKVLLGKGFPGEPDVISISV